MSRLDDIRFEVLPFGSVEEEAAATPRPRTITVTCSPKHGLDRSVDVACRLATSGHTVVMHIAARWVTSPGHAAELLAQLRAAGINDLFLIGGDCERPVGPYDSATSLLPVLRNSSDAPKTIGVAAYPEGHPRIDGNALLEALRAKDGAADYMVTQLCFDASVLIGWLARTREAGIRLPLFAGVPGLVDRRRLAEISLRVGVGASLSYLRKQHGIRQLLGRHGHVAEALCSELAPRIGGELGIAGLQFFTFNRLSATAAFADRLAIDHQEHTAA